MEKSNSDTGSATILSGSIPEAKRTRRNAMKKHSKSHLVWNVVRAQQERCMLANTTGGIVHGESCRGFLPTKKCITTTLSSICLHARLGHININTGHHRQNLPA
eukprot:3637283-Amphidinium_carterae.1